MNIISGSVAEVCLMLHTFEVLKFCAYDWSEIHYYAL